MSREEKSAVVAAYAYSLARRVNESRGGLPTPRLFVLPVDNAGLLQQAFGTLQH